MKSNLHIYLVCLVSLASSFCSDVAAADEVLVPIGSAWKYLDNGSNQGTAWRGTQFDDSAWAAGPAQLGYGDSDEATLVGYGPDAGNKYVTTYFRCRFDVVDAASVTLLRINLLRDDGAVVYLNGTELRRDNLPSGTISYNTYASVALGGSDETTFFPSSHGPAGLVEGQNVIAVEVHQANATSTDISFDLELLASRDTGDLSVLVRGPYLQMATPSSLIVRWRTDLTGSGRVRYGPAPGNWIGEVTDSTVATDHLVELSGLSPDTTYFYEVGTATGWFAGGGGEFLTPPAVGTVRPSRLWILGDSGTADANAAAVRDAYLAFNAGGRTDLMLMLGDNAYSSGTDAQYQAAVFNMYPTVLRDTVLWSTIGNHDTAQSANPPSSLPYFQIFSFPTAGEAGGLASGTEKYYSFDYANIHFICLDSMTSDRSPGGPMLTWLSNDLLGTSQDWIIAFWHHPPYTKGSHNSDTETELIEMRVNALPILEAGGVDMVLSGHSHSYERSFLIDGHYGTSSTFSQSMKKDGGDGREDGTGAYVKQSGLNPNDGAVYVVAGSSGQTSGGSLNHPAMFISLNVLGSLVLDMDGSRLDAVFLDAAGNAADHFTLLKSGGSPTPPAAPSDLSASPVSSSAIALAWVDNSTNEDGFQIERSSDGVNFVEIATVGANVTNGLDTGLIADTTYYYRVRAFNGVGQSANSPVASATTLASVQDNLAVGEVTDAGVLAGSYQDTWDADGAAESISEIQSGGKPINRYTFLQHTWTFNVAAGNMATLLINAWAPASADGDHFRISYSEDGLNFVDVFQVFKTSNEGTVDAFALPATGGGSVYVRVQDTDRTPAHRDADTVFVDYLSIRTEETGPTELPTAPAALAASALSANEIDLSWTDTSAAEEGVQIERSTDGLNFSYLDTVGPNQTVYFDTSVAPTTTYYYRVRAFNALGNSDYSNTATTTTPAAPPPAPSGLIATAVALDRIDLAWLDNSSTETGYNIERSADGVVFSVLATVGADSVAYADTGLSRNRLYYYRVQALSSSGPSAYSNIASAKTLKK